MFKLFSNCQILQPDLSLKKGNILVQDDTIYDICYSDVPQGKPVDSEIDLEGHIVFPGMINSHDHLVDTCWHGLGETPAENWYEWYQTARASEDYKLLQKLSVTDLYIAGMYKNVISGATTIVDHFPAEVSKTFSGHPLATLLEHFYLAHSVSSYQLQWGKNTSDQFKQARGILPFIIHAGEGKSREISEEIECLNRMGALEKNTVIINGCFLQQQDLQLIASKGASIVWLPTSSQKIFGQQPDIAKILDLGISLAIGTDSSISGSSDILSELRFAMEFSKKSLNGLLKPSDIIRMVTSGAAKIFGIDKAAGELAPGKRADMIIFEADPTLDHCENFLRKKPENFAMVIHRGTMIVGNDEFRKMSSVDFSQYSEVKIRGTAKLLLGQPVQLLERIRHKVSKEVIFPFFDITSED